MALRVCTPAQSNLLDVIHIMRRRQSSHPAATIAPKRYKCCVCIDCIVFFCIDVIIVSVCKPPTPGKTNAEQAVHGTFFRYCATESPSILTIYAVYVETALLPSWRILVLPYSNDWWIGSLPDSRTQVLRLRFQDKAIVSQPITSLVVELVPAISSLETSNQKLHSGWEENLDCRKLLNSSCALYYSVSETFLNWGPPFRSPHIPSFSGWKVIWREYMLKSMAKSYQQRSALYVSRVKHWNRSRVA
jgi:hypothetical protein